MLSRVEECVTGGMKLGISSYTYTWAVGVPGYAPGKLLDAFGLLDRAAKLGVARVQIADNLPLHLLAPGDLDELSYKAAQAGIGIEVGTRGLTGENLHAYLNVAAQLKSSILRIVVDGQDYHPHPDECVAVIKEFVPELQSRNVTLAIENHDRFTARTFADIVNRVGSDRAGICLDSVNSIGAGEGIETIVEILAPLTINLHVKDYAAKRLSHMMGFTIEGRPAGQGMLAVEWLLERVQSHSRCESAILELWTPPEERLADTIEKEARWAVESVGYLRQLVAE